MNLLNELISIVEKFSPAVGLILGSPLSGVGINLIANAVNANPSDIKDVINKINNDPNADSKIKDMEGLFNDMLSARNREVAYTNATKQRDWMLPVLAVLVAVGFFLTVWVVIFGDFDQEERYFMYGLVLGIGVQFAQVYNYYFGKFNNDLLSTLATPFVKFYNTIFKKP